MKRRHTLEVTARNADHPSRRDEMSTQRTLGLAFLATSLLMLFFGYQSDDGASGTRGEHAAGTVWYWAIGAFSAAAGAVMLQLGERSDRRQARRVVDRPTRAQPAR